MKFNRDVFGRDRDAVIQYVCNCRREVIANRTEGFNQGCRFGGNQVVLQWWQLGHWIKSGLNLSSTKRTRLVLHGPNANCGVLPQATPGAETKVSTNEALSWDSSSLCSDYRIP